MSAFRHRVLLATLAAVLVFAVALIIYGETRPLERTFYGSVKDLLPKPEEVPGWTVEYLPIADTPEMQEKVNELLNYDDAVYAVYTKGAERISIYIAYWTPGKMSQRLIAAHTPDVCWVGAGWKIVEAKSANEDTRLNLKAESEDVRRGTGSLPAEESFALPPQGSGDVSTFKNIGPVVQLFAKLESHVTGFQSGAGEWRLMKQNGHIEQVTFWHLSGNKIVSYGRGTPHWTAAIIEATGAFDQRGEQVFIRISAPTAPSTRN